MPSAPERGRRPPCCLPAGLPLASLALAGNPRSVAHLCGVGQGGCLPGAAGAPLKVKDQEAALGPSQVSKQRFQPQKWGFWGHSHPAISQHLRLQKRFWEVEQGTGYFLHFPQILSKHRLFLPWIPSTRQHGGAGQLHTRAFFTHAPLHAVPAAGSIPPKALVWAFLWGGWGRGRFSAGPRGPIPARSVEGAQDPGPQRAHASQTLPAAA